MTKSKVNISPKYLDGEEPPTDPSSQVRLGCAVATLTNRASYRAGWTGLVLYDLCMDSTLKASFAREVAVGFNNFN